MIKKNAKNNNRAKKKIDTKERFDQKRKTYLRGPVSSTTEKTIP